jgi:hypothetical protein
MSLWVFLKTGIPHIQSRPSLAIRKLGGQLSFILWLYYPLFKGRGLGRVLMMAYMQQMNGAGIADRLALIARDVSLKTLLI